jgi:flagellar biosynthesis protein FlhG
MDLRDAIECLSTHVFYLAARGLPLHFVNTHGSTAGFVTRLMDAVPEAEVLLIHAPATDLCRLLGRSSGGQALEEWSQDARPLLLVDDRPSSVTHGYAGLKLLAQRGRLMVHDFLLGAAENSPRAARIAEQLTSCAEHFLGAVVREVLLVDPATDARDPPPAVLRRWARSCLQPAVPATDSPMGRASTLESGVPPFYSPPQGLDLRADLNSWS